MVCWHRPYTRVLDPPRVLGFSSSASPVYTFSAWTWSRLYAVQPCSIVFLMQFPFPGRDVDVMWQLSFNKNVIICVMAWAQSDCKPWYKLLTVSLCNSVISFTLDQVHLHNPNFIHKIIIAQIVLTLSKIELCVLLLPQRTNQCNRQCC